MAIKRAVDVRREAEHEHERAIEAARDFAQRAAEEWGANAVYLFGSRARNEWRRGSDVDVIVVSDRFEGMSRYERTLALSRLWTGPVGCEPIGLSLNEWLEGRDRVGIVSMALEDGLVQLWPKEAIVTAG